MRSTQSNESARRTGRASTAGAPAAAEEAAGEIEMGETEMGEIDATRESHDELVGRACSRLDAQRFVSERFVSAQVTAWWRGLRCALCCAAWPLVCGFGGGLHLEGAASRCEGQGKVPS